MEAAFLMFQMQVDDGVTCIAVGGPIFPAVPVDSGRQENCYPGRGNGRREPLNVPTRLFQPVQESFVVH
jgi:hypothetical protein